MPSSKEANLQLLSNKIAQLGYVRDFRRTEKFLREDAPLWAEYEQMKQLQKDAVLYQQIGKKEAFKETAKEAQKIEKQLKNNPTVEDYFIKMQDVGDLLQHIIQQIEDRVNESL